MPDKNDFSPAKKIGHLLAQELKNNPNFYFFSPDETTSNRFDEVFDVESRAWNLPIESWDLPESPSGHIIEMLSENILFSVMTGHLMNDEPAMMGSYEAFYPIITSQLLQHIKFICQAKKVSWRPDYPALNLLSTSTCWRQDHNGFTHQSPALISTLLSHPSDISNCFFPADDQAAEATFKYMLKSKNCVNLTTFNKIEEPRYLDQISARAQLQDQSGVYVFPEFSDQDPDLVFAAVGDIQTKESLAAARILKSNFPFLQIRLVNISALSYRAIGPYDNKLAKSNFEQIFTKDKPIIANFHGYPETLETILENYAARGRLRVHGFNEQGSTTTPFEMLAKNAASRFDLMLDVATLAKRDDLIKKYRAIIRGNHDYALSFGEDLIY